jgi:hypothetical protein
MVDFREGEEALQMTIQKSPKSSSAEKAVEQSTGIA